MDKSQIELSGTAVLAIAGVIAAGALVWWVSRKASKSAASGAVGAVSDTAAGAVVGLGNLVGIPDTNQSQGVKDLQAGDWWNASFDLPAGDFLGAAFDKLRGRDPVAGLTGGKVTMPAPSLAGAGGATLNNGFTYNSWNLGDFTGSGD